MTFELVRWNWPNTAAILALAVLPVVAMAATLDHAAPPRATYAAAPASPCQSVAELTTTAALETDHDLRLVW